MPEIREAPLSSIPSLINNVPPTLIQNEESHDVFISHASEDKDEIVRPLANALIAEGLTVWYDEFSLKIGDSLRRKIDPDRVDRTPGQIKRLLVLTDPLEDFAPD